MKPKWLYNNFWIKTGALALAVSLWFYVAGEETIDAHFTIPMQFLLADGMVAVEQGSDSVSVYISGRKELISELVGKDMFGSIDMSRYNLPQTVVLPVERKNLPLPSDVTVLQIIPDKMEVRIDRLVEKVLLVKADVFGEPAPGYAVEGIMIDPINALIKGPEGTLKDMIYIDTEKVGVTGRQKSFKKMVPLKSVPMVGSKIPPQFVEVVVRIEEMPKGKSRVKS